MLLYVRIIIISVASGLNLLLVEGSISNGRCHRRRNQGVSLESGSFSVDQFYESVVCMRKIEVV